MRGQFMQEQIHNLLQLCSLNHQPKLMATKTCGLWPGQRLSRKLSKKIKNNHKQGLGGETSLMGHYRVSRQRLLWPHYQSGLCGVRPDFTSLSTSLTSPAPSIDGAVLKDGVTWPGPTSNTGALRVPGTLRVPGALRVPLAGLEHESQLVWLPTKVQYMVQ